LLCGSGKDFGYEQEVIAVYRLLHSTLAKSIIRLSEEGECGWREWSCGGVVNGETTSRGVLEDKFIKGTSACPKISTLSRGRMRVRQQRREGREGGRPGAPLRFTFYEFKDQHIWLLKSE
jgi:hypothetical protein